MKARANGRRLRPASLNGRPSDYGFNMRSRLRAASSFALAPEHHRLGAHGLTFSSVSLIGSTCGAYRPFLHDRHFSAGLARVSNVQSLFDHHQPSRDQKFTDNGAAQVACLRALVHWAIFRIIDPDQEALAVGAYRFLMSWQPIVTAPFDRDLELAVLDAGEAHALVFPCRRVPTGWLRCGTDERVSVHPTHWREWKD
jgi:hypothetical protein